MRMGELRREEPLWLRVAVHMRGFEIVPDEYGE
jgi:hypothetical protein